MCRFRYAIVYHHKCITNIPHFTQHLCTHNYEEVDTLIILLVLDVSSINPFVELIINSPDTDVYLLLVYYQTKLCNRTSFCTGRGRDVCSIDVKIHMKVLVWNELKHYLATMLSVAVILLVSLTGSPSWQHGDTLTVPLMLCWMSSRRGLPDLSILYETTAKLQTYVMTWYCEKRPSSIKTIGELR